MQGRKRGLKRLSLLEFGAGIRSRTLARRERGSRDLRLGFWKISFFGGKDPIQLGILVLSKHKTRLGYLEVGSISRFDE
jgi:hypothetical protein